jgi:hypothetical protein
MQQKVYYKWNDLNILWSLVDMPWNDVFYLIEIGEALGGGFPGFAGPGFGVPHKYNAPAELVKSKLKPEQYSIFIKILCKVNGIKSEEMKRRKVSNLPEISIIEINRTMEEVFKPIVRLKKVFRSDI